MSAAAQTRIFGIRVGVDPKFLVGGLIAFAVLLWWYNSRGDDQGSAPATAVPASPSVASPSSARARAGIARRTAPVNDRGLLRLRPIDATKGDVDPTLRLDLLVRLRSVPLVRGGRNLFEVGPPPGAALVPVPKGPTIIPKPLPPPVQVISAAQAPNPVLDIPLKYYGYTQPAEKGQTNRGFFLDGENVLVAAEGETMKQRYLVVELTPNSARLEDIQVKKGQTLPVVPVAAAAQ